jgi:hypothetical protein
MALKPPGKGAVIYGNCTNQNKAIGIRFEKRGEVWVLHWSFRTEEHSAQKINSGAINMTNLDTDPSFRGCPYCDNMTFWYCNCGNANCWDGTTLTVWCPTCKEGGELGELDGIQGGSGR